MTPQLDEILTNLRTFLDENKIARPCMERFASDRDRSGRAARAERHAGTKNGACNMAWEQNGVRDVRRGAHGGDRRPRLSATSHILRDGRGRQLHPRFGAGRGRGVGAGGARHNRHVLARRAILPVSCQAAACARVPLLKSYTYIYLRAHVMGQCRAPLPGAGPCPGPPWSGY